MIQLAVRETIKSELSLTAIEYHDGSIEIQLKLGDEEIGVPFYISVSTDTEHRHNFDYVTEVGLEVS